MTVRWRFVTTGPGRRTPGRAHSTEVPVTELTTPTTTRPDVTAPTRMTVSEPPEARVRVRSLAVAVAVAVLASAFVPWGSESASADSVVAPAPQSGSGVGVVSAAPMALSRAVTSQSEDPVAVDAAAAYRSLALARRLGSRVEPLGYEELRDRVAAGVAERLELDPNELSAIWSGTAPERQLALLAGLSQLGVPYKRYGRTPGVGLDCSGLTSFAWSMGGLELPRSSRSQRRVGDQVPAAEVQPGDLVYYPGHIMMSLGVPGAILHSPEPGRTVTIKLSPERKYRRWSHVDPLA